MGDGEANSIHRWLRRAVIVAYVLTVGLFLWSFARFRDPIGGFAYLIDFGAKQNLPQIAELKTLDHSIQNYGYGYDAQYYVQIAMHPGLRAPGLTDAIDNPAYRARRILFGWTAYVLGLGRPAWILQAYAVQNALAWLLLAAVLLRWFPPDGWENFFRWAGVLFCGGLCMSVRYALVDGPSLLLIAAGVACVEMNRPWLATAVFGVSGLGRETNVLAAASLFDMDRRTPRDWFRLAVQAAIVAAPLALWLVYVQQMLGRSLDAGDRNFDAPFLSFVTKWRDIWNGLRAHGWGNLPARSGLWLMMSLSVQAAFLLGRPAWRQTWWRVGAGYTLLMLVLGASIWEGYPVAAARLLLPMQLAFNVLVPRGRGWLLVLLLGNLTLLGAPEMLSPPPGAGYVLTKEPALAGTGENVRLVFDHSWFNVEQRNGRSWRWSPGTAAFSIINPAAVPLRGRAEFYLDGLPGNRRRITVSCRGVECWSGWVEGEMKEPIVLPALRLDPGENPLVIATDATAVPAEERDGRTVAYSLRDLQIRLGPLTP